MRIFGWAGDDCCVSKFVVGHFFSSLKNLLGAVLFVGIIEMLERGGWQETSPRRRGTESMPSSPLPQLLRTSSFIIAGLSILLPPNFLLVTNNNYKRGLMQLAMHATHFAHCYRN